MNDNLPTLQSENETESSALVEVEKSRAVQEVQAALIIAKKYPRDTNTAYTKIIKSCERFGLAEQALYKYPRGGEIVKGPSIRLAEVIAQNYGNLDFGVREIERRSNVSLCESYCWDMETNTRQTKQFEVPHLINLKGGKVKRLTDSRDIYEIVANMGARRMRACILGIIPVDIVEDAVKACEKTLAKGDGKETLTERIRKMLLAFSAIGVNQEMIEAKLGHSVDDLIADELVDLISIYKSISDKVAKRSDFFNFKDEELSTNKELTESIKGTKNDN
jgi:hypothetical protein